MFEPNEALQKNDRLLASAPQPRTLEERKQRRMMITALALLLLALGFVLYRDRDFWFPETQEAEDQPESQQISPAATNPTQTVVPQSVSPARKKSRSSKPLPKASAPAKSAEVDPAAPPITATTTRTVLPPLEVEVVAGDVHRTLHPGTNSVRIDLQPGSASPGVSVASSVSSTNDNASAAGVTRKAAENVQMSADTADVVSRPVKPDYPLLARQMKVQGSVILQALIGRDGLIQGLQVLSGPPILASAAQEAVKQWHFKPHFQGAESVETQARITVNFTISTN